MVNKQIRSRVGRRFKHTALISTIVLISSLWSTGWSAKIVYPWRATTAIVKAGETFDVLFIADSGQTINSVQLEGPYNTEKPSISQVSGSWVYDKVSGNTYNRKITVTVPASAPEDRYNLVVKTSTGDVISKSAVKVVKQYQSSYYIVHMSDGDRYLRGVNATNTMKKVSAILNYASIMDAQMVIETGDLLYGADDYNPIRCDQMYDGIASLGINGIYDSFAPTFMVIGNHDNPTDASTYDSAKASQYFNTYHGMSYYTFSYGNGRFMMLNDFGATVSANEAKAWLNTVGSGNFRLGAFHGPTGTGPNLLTTQSGMTLGLAGHTHTTSANPEPNNTYVASDVLQNFQFNVYKINNDTGAITLPTGSKAYTDAILNMTDRGNPALWQLKLMLNYARTNNGTSISNSATITNKFNFPIDGARIRFVMPKGNTYTVSAGTIQQQFDGTTYRIVDVKVNVAAINTAVVTINASPINQVSVPNVINQTEAAAKSSITGAGLTVGGVSSNYHATVAAGIIYSQTPGAGTLVASNSSVALAVSKGPVPEVSVPNVINLTEAAAKSSITSAGLTVSGVSSNYHATVAAGLIYSQTPGAGAMVASNSSVALAVSKGQSNQPPSFVSDPFSMASANEASAYRG
ncbi:MAG: PASTA domain-containing protein, partial [Kiritimatiellaceae bacterium]|nr:PASTA domain-containing protein [Kiritimatiellaceae bacterium]